MPFFSILIPAYNAEPFISACLDSVINQPFQDYEVVVVNDGSVDQTLQILKSYENRYSQIHVISQANAGQLSARKTAFVNSSGQYILWLDADDFFQSDILQDLFILLDQNRYDLVIFNHQRVDEFGRFLKVCTPCFKEQTDLSKENLVKLYVNGKINEVCFKAVKRTCISDLCFFYKNIFNGEDMLQTLFLINNAKSAVYLPQCYYNYRVNMKGISRTLNLTKMKDITFVCTKIYASLIIPFEPYHKFAGNLFAYWWSAILWQSFEWIGNGYDRQSLYDMYRELSASELMVHVRNTNIEMPRFKKIPLFLFLKQRYLCLSNLLVLYNKLFKLFKKEEIS